MKAILEFDFDNPESDDRLHFEDAVNGSKWKIAMWDLDQDLRSKTKYAGDDMSQETYDALVQTRDRLHQIMGEYGLNFD